MDSETPIGALKYLFNDGLGLQKNRINDKKYLLQIKVFCYFFVSRKGVVFTMRY